MKAAACLLIAAALHVGAASAMSIVLDSIDVDSFARCPGGAAWLRAQRETATKSTPVAATNPAYHDALIALASSGILREPGTDAASIAAEAAAAAADAAAAAADAAVDAAAGSEASRAPPKETLRVSERRSRFEALVARHGLPRVIEIGSDGMAAFLNLLRGSPAQLRVRIAEEMLRMSRADSGDVNARLLAEVLDGALLELRRPQRYGTDYAFDARGQIVLASPVDDIAGLAARRAAAGLAPLALELCVRRASHSIERWTPSF